MTKCRRNKSLMTWRAAFQQRGYPKNSEVEVWPIPDGPRVAGRSSESALPPPELDEAQWKMWAKKAPSRGHCAKASPMLGVRGRAVHGSRELDRSLLVV